jgi:hypothetical protein
VQGNGAHFPCYFIGSLVVKAYSIVGQKGADFHSIIGRSGNGVNFVKNGEGKPGALDREETFLRGVTPQLARDV